ncbi:hypothetical protein BKA63DRAFT_594012 [Paraphoma chrysanthemicola]|nr:hypothetical protein BKA63DRAFT_594012 [Paraphoma chrysanthemicola]
MTNKTSLAMTTRSNAIESSLLRLPAELRNKIYAYVFYEGTYCLKISNRTRPGHYLPEKVPVCLEQCNHALALLRVCRQVHAEAKLFPYWLNVFQFDSLLAFQFCIGLESRKHRFTLEQRQAVRTLELELYLGWEFYTDWYKLAAYVRSLKQQDINIQDMLPNLQAVTVIVDGRRGETLDETLAKHYGKENWAQTEKWLVGE